MKALIFALCLFASATATAEQYTRSDGYERAVIFLNTDKDSQIWAVAYGAFDEWYVGLNVPNCPKPTSMSEVMRMFTTIAGVLVRKEDSTSSLSLQATAAYKTLYCN